MKKLFCVTAFLLMGLALLGCATTSTTTNSVTTTTTTTNNLNYSDFSEDHITVVDEQLLMPEVTYYVYYYGINCTHCQEIKSSVLGIARDLTIDTLYFVSVTTLSDLADGSGVTRTPTLLKIVNGAVSGHYEGESQIMPVLEGLD